MRRDENKKLSGWESSLIYVEKSGVLFLRNSSSSPRRMSAAEYDHFAWQGTADPIIGSRPLSIVSGQCKAHVSIESWA